MKQIYSCCGKTCVSLIHHKHYEANQQCRCRKDQENSADYLQYAVLAHVLNCFFDAEPGIVVYLFLNFEQECASCSYEVLVKKGVAQL